MPLAAHARRWTLEEMHALPESSTRYELVYGELWVTPAPKPPHETILARLTRLLDRYVEAQQLGMVYHPRAVFRVRRDIELEPDLMVRQELEDSTDWEYAPPPLLVVEVVSPSSRKRDYGRKIELYLSNGIAEYWIIDGQARTITVAKPDGESRLVTGTLTWSPASASEPLSFDVARVFGSG